MEHPKNTKTTPGKRYKFEDLRGWLEGDDPAPLEEIRDIHEGKALVRKDFVKDFTAMLGLCSPMERVLLASKHPINPGKPGWEQRMADMFKTLWGIVKNRR